MRRADRKFSDEAIKFVLVLADGVDVEFEFFFGTRRRTSKSNLLLRDRMYILKFQK